MLETNTIFSLNHGRELGRWHVSRLYENWRQDEVDQSNTPPSDVDNELVRLGSFSRWLQSLFPRRAS